VTPQVHPTAVDLWRRDPERSVASQLGIAMLDGEWRSKRDAEELGASPSMLSQTVTTLRNAGYTLETEPAGPNGLSRYRVKPARTPAAARSNGNVRREVDGVTYPRLGATLTVRALVLGDDGGLVVQLTDGAGGAWSAHVTGHVG
jgi:hypothetical protein